jgi:hypothetical protein
VLLLRRAVSALIVVVLAFGLAVTSSVLEGSRAEAIPLRPTSTTLESSGSPSAAGEAVTFTATVLRPWWLFWLPHPTSGTVTFYDGPDPLGSGTVDSEHEATFSTASLAPGTHSITANFEGDEDYIASTSEPLTHDVDAPIATTTSVASNLDPSQYTQSVTFTATVAAATGDPTGAVSFADGLDVIAGCDAQPLSAGVATCTTNALGIGTHSVTASYGGSPSHSASASNPIDQVVSPLTTTVSLSADLNPSTYGDLVTYTAIVSAPAGAAPTDGTVTFMDGVDVIGSTPVDASAVAAITMGSLGAGTHSVTASFGGNSTHAGSTSDPLEQHVDKAGTTTTVSYTTNPSVFGDTVIFSAHVTPAPGSGFVQFAVDGVDLGAPVAIDPYGDAASDPVADLVVGDHEIAATFLGNANFNGSQGSYTQAVTPAPTTTSLLSDVNPSVHGGTVTFTATVASTTGTPTGTVTFQSDGATIPGCDLQALTAGIATCVTDSFDAGTHAVTASYSGASSYQASSAAPLDQVVDLAPSTTVLTTDLNPATFGDDVTLTATITGVPAGSVPTGTVQFSVDGTPVGGPVTVAAGSASLVVGLGAGDHEVLAEYSGGANYFGSSDSLTQAIEKAATSTVVVSDVDPSVYGDAVTFTATVSPHPASGSVQFSVDGVDFGAPVAVGSGGVAVSEAIASLDAGSHDIEATFSGTANYTSSVGPLTQTVLRRATTTAVTSDVNPSVFGDTVTLTATVSPAPAAGSVQFSIDGVPAGGPVAISGGSAALVTATLAPGTHDIDAEFTGSQNFAPSTGELTQTVALVPSTTTLANTPGSPNAGALFTLTATVTGVPSGSSPTGTIQFAINGANVGSPVPVSLLGTASLNTPAPAAGTHFATAAYSGDPEYLPSSATTSLTVTNPPAPPAPKKNGYWMVGRPGSVFTFGDLPYKGGTTVGNAIDIEATRTGQGYWILTLDGTLHRFGDAPNFGDARGRLAAGERAVSMSATPSNNGYWIFTDLGRAIALGGAAHYGDLSGIRLNGPVLGSISTPTGKGYYMVATDGGVFSFGDARFYGSMGATRLNQPVMGLVPDSDNVGYWLVARDGGVFSFDAPFRGSMGGTRLNKPVIGMVGWGLGYLMVAEDGGIFSFSNVPFRGSLGANPPPYPIVSVAAWVEQ